MVHHAGRFAFTAPLERRWQEIRAEYLAVGADLSGWIERDLYAGAWEVYGLFDFPGGAPIAHHTRRCPLTAALVRRLFPRHGAAGFSVLRPGTRIRPHRGSQGPFLRCHLALVVPAGDAGLAVAGEVRRWEAGRALVFDDRVEHEAWNLTAEDRVVLLVDFVPDF